MGEIQLRRATPADAEACGRIIYDAFCGIALCKGVHGFERTNELRDSLNMLRPFVLLRNGRVAAYASAPTFWILNHGVAQTERDMIDLLLAAGAANAEPISLLGT
jgi:hypothetical protein